MSKIRLGLMIAATCFVTSVSFGQELFSFQPPPTSNNSVKRGAAPAPVLSPSEFKNKVATMGQQTQQDMLQQSQSNIKEQSNQLSLPNSPPPPLKMNTPQQGAAQPTQNTGGKKTPAQSMMDSALAPPEEQATPAQPAAQQPVRPAPTTAAPTTPPPPPGYAEEPQQSQVYTGFGAGTKSGGTTGTSTSQPSGGWNVKY